MIDELRALTSFAKSRTLHIDGTVFRLHCRLTTVCLSVALFMVSTTQFVGSPIYCDVQSLQIASEMLNAFCYVQSTYTMVSPEQPSPGSNNRSSKSMSVSGAYLQSHSIELYPGIRGSMSVPRQYPAQQRVHYYYYQWIWVIYLLQAVAFYLPNWIWKVVEGGRLRQLISGIDILVTPVSNGRLVLLANYIVHSFGSNRKYIVSYYLCELLAFANLLGQMYLLDIIFDHRFLSYGFDTVRMMLLERTHTNEAVYNPMTLIFPKMTKCEYRRFGPSGHVDIMDSLCMLPLNNFNDKFFLILWFWMVTLGILFVLVFVYRAMQIGFVRLRFSSLRKQIHLASPKDSKPCQQLTAADKIELNLAELDCEIQPLRTQQIQSLVYSISKSDWFFISMIGYNLDRLVFYQLLCHIATCYQRTRTGDSSCCDCSSINGKQTPLGPDGHHSDSSSKLLQQQLQPLQDS